MKSETVQTRIRWAIQLAFQKKFPARAFVRTLAALLFTAAGVMGATSTFNATAPLSDEWVRQSPLPSPRNLTGVTWATVTHGFASGEALTLIETFDGGVTWRNVNLGTTSTN